MTEPQATTPPTGGAVLMLLARTSFRRKFNHYTAGLQNVFRKKKTATPAKRQATPRKRVGSVLLGIYLAVCIVFSISNLTAIAFRNAKAIVSSPSAESPDQWTQIKDLAKEVASDKPPGPAPSREAIKERLPWPSPALAPAPEHWPGFLQLQAGLLCLMAAAIWLMGFAAAKQELGHGGWSLEWLATFPVPVNTLLIARVGEYALTNAFLWLGGGSYLLALFIVLGQGWSAVPLAVTFTLLLGIALAAVQVLAETALRKRFATHTLKNLQAVGSLAGTGCYLAVLGCLMSPWLLRKVFVWSQQLPVGVGWLPPALPATACLPGQLWPSLGGMVLASGAVTGACLWLSGRLLRNGLVANAGTFAGNRGKAGRAASTGPADVAGKDLRLLRRDRTVLVQTLLVPLLIAVFQAIMNPGGARAILANPNHLAACAFGIGAYMLCFSALHVLTWEGPGLWFLYTFPEKLERLLVRKVVLWAIVAFGYTGAVFAAGVGLGASVSPALIAGAALALVGVALHAFIAAGIGILGADPLQPDIRHRLNASHMLMYMMLASMYAYAIYAPSAWTKLSQVVLSALLAYALWQKVRDHLPFLLDPVSAPPPRISLSDGMIAAVSFFVLQGLIGVILLSTEALSPGLAFFVAFGAAGVLVAVFTLFTFWRQRVPNLLAEVGFRRPADGAGAGLFGGIGIGLATGAAAAGGAWLFLRLVPHIPALQALAMEQKAQQAFGDSPSVIWIALLTVAAAPVCEEYIFRGLVFRGLRRSVRPGLAIVASAAIFAVVHPPLSVIPVFVLGLACAFAFERSKTLWAPMATHALYNAVVLFILTPAFMAKLPEPPPPQVFYDAARPAEAGKDELVLPESSLAGKKQFPLLVVLHDSGGWPQEALEPVQDLVKPWQYAMYAPCGSIRVGADTVRSSEPGYDWNAARDLDRVAAQVREWLAKYPIHPGAVYLVGCGSGANLAYLLGIRHPELFTGVIAVGGRIQTELLSESEIRRAAPLLPVYSTHDSRRRALPPEITTATDDFFQKHGFANFRGEFLRAPKVGGILRHAIDWIVTQRAELQKRLSEQTPEQAAAAMRQEVPADMAVEVDGRFVIASNAPEAARRRFAADFDVLARRCAALIGRGDPRTGPAIRVYYPLTRAEQASLYRSIMGTEIIWQHGSVTWLPTRAWGSADVGNGTLTHELVHVFVQSDWPQLPGWLNESLAVALGGPKVALRSGPGFATDDLWLLAGRQALAQDRWTPVETVFADKGSDYQSLDTVDLEIAPGLTVKVGPLLTGRLLVRMLNETGRLDRFYQAWRDGKGVAGALQAIASPSAEALDRELRQWIADR